MKLIIRLHPPTKLKISGYTLHPQVVLNPFPVFPQVSWMRTDFSMVTKIQILITAGRERFPSHFSRIFFRHGLQSRSGFSARAAAVTSQPSPSSAVLVTPSHSYRTQKVWVVPLAHCYLLQRARVEMSTGRPSLMAK